MTSAESPSPLALPRAIAIFALSALPFWIGLYAVLPGLVRRGTAVPLALSAAFLIPLSLLLVAATIVGRRERDGPGWAGLRRRWRLGSPRWSDVGWAAVLLVVTLTAYLGLAGTAEWFQSSAGLAPPSEFDLVQSEGTFFGFELAGNWWVLVLHVGILALNVAGEELWFRGVLFPRQEAAHGSRAWIVHGLCYHGFHMFYPWGVLRLLPESLMYGWIAQRTGSTWPGFLSHLAFNGLALIATVSGVLTA